MWRRKEKEKEQPPAQLSKDDAEEPMVGTRLADRELDDMPGKGSPPLPIIDTPPPAPAPPPRTDTPPRRPSMQDLEGSVGLLEVSQNLGRSGRDPSRRRPSAPPLRRGQAAQSPPFSFGSPGSGWVPEADETVRPRQDAPAPGSRLPRGTPTRRRPASPPLPAFSQQFAPTEDEPSRPQDVPSPSSRLQARPKQRQASARRPSEAEALRARVAELEDALFKQSEDMRGMQPGIVLSQSVPVASQQADKPLKRRQGSYQPGMQQRKASLQPPQQQQRRGTSGPRAAPGGGGGLQPTQLGQTQPQGRPAGRSRGPVTLQRLQQTLNPPSPGTGTRPAGTFDAGHI
eukprot:TRINITY_DN4953_c0_g1_i4.p3 TRINITY_DN4953_c0_g1~~TRINITY_DN4953_c0_g1_i4.p3  ORF type:complete len:343 (+),score=119.70 TRINITY_DN4953_c0_g1_i4:1664-2692(+)